MRVHPPGKLAGSSNWDKLSPAILGIFNQPFDHFKLNSSQQFLQSRCQRNFSSLAGSLFRPRSYLEAGDARPAWTNASQTPRLCQTSVESRAPGEVLMINMVWLGGSSILRNTLFLKQRMRTNQWLITNGSYKNRDIPNYEATKVAGRRLGTSTMDNLKHHDDSWPVASSIDIYRPFKTIITCDEIWFLWF